MNVRFVEKIYEGIDHFNKHIKTCTLTLKKRKKKSRMPLHESEDQVVSDMLNEDERVEEIPALSISENFNDDIGFRSCSMVFESDT